MESGDKITSPEAGSASIQSSWMKNNNYNGLRSKKKKCDQSLGFFFTLKELYMQILAAKGCLWGPHTQATHLRSSGAPWPHLLVLGLF